MKLYTYLLTGAHKYNIVRFWSPYVYDKFDKKARDKSIILTLI